MSKSDRVTHQAPSAYGNASDRVISAEARGDRYGDSRSYYGPDEDYPKVVHGHEGYYDDEHVYASDNSTKAVYGATTQQPNKTARSRSSPKWQKDATNDITKRAEKAVRAYEDALDAKEMALREIKSILHIEKIKKSLDAGRQVVLNDRLVRELEDIVAAERSRGDL